MIMLYVILAGGFALFSLLLSFILWDDGEELSALFLLTFAAAPLWPIAILALWLYSGTFPWSVQGRLHLRIWKARRERKILALRSEAEAEEAATREAMECDLDQLMEMAE